MKKYIIPFLALVLATACVDDEGTYDYDDINQINAEGFESGYSLLAYIDTLKIDPKIEGSVYGDDESNYTYKWYLCYDDHRHHDVIGTERKLVWPANIPEGEYAVYLSVTDKNTTVEKLFYTGLRTTSPFNRGFLILGNDMESGKAALDMITMAPGRDTTMVENVCDISGLNMTKPDKLLFAGLYSGTRAARLWLIGDNRAHCLLGQESESTALLQDMGEFTQLGIVELPDVEHETPMVIRDMFPRPNNRMRSSMNRGYITNDLVVYGMTIMSEYFAEPSNRYSTTGKLFKPYPLAFAAGAASSYLVTSHTLIFDMDNGCFTKLAQYGGNVTKMQDAAGDPWMFDMASERRELLYGENGYESQGRGYVIAKDKGSDSNIRYIYRWAYPRSSASTWPCTKEALYTVDPAIATDFDKAEHIMFSSNKTAVLYSIGKRLYQYDYVRKLCAYHDFPAEITYLEAEYCSRASVSEFLVATYSDSDKGMIYKMRVPENPNAVEFEFLENQTWPTRLKVADVEWKNN